MKYLITLIVFLIVPFTLLFAENSKESTTNYNDKLTIKITSEKPTLNSKISFADEELLYLPNTMANGSVSVSYKNFGLSVGTELDGSQKDEEEYGSTEYDDYRLYYYKRKFGVDVFYSSYKGFYLDNPTDYGNIAGDTTAKRGDLKIKNYGLNGFYIFSDNYSLSSSFDFGESQTKSGGSILIMTSISQLKIDSDYSLIPPARETLFSADAGYRGGQYTMVSILPGAAYTLIVDNFFITGVLFFGGGAVQKKQITNEGENISIVSYGKTNVRISVGYNNDSFFGGFMAFGDLSGFSSQKETNVKIDSIQMKLYFGMRFF